jgi:hypothetical protein
MNEACMILPWLTSQYFIKAVKLWESADNSTVICNLYSAYFSFILYKFKHKGTPLFTNEKKIFLAKLIW